MYYRRYRCQTNTLTLNNRPNREGQRIRLGGHDGDRSRRGAALVEFAVVLPVFLMVVMETIEFGRAFMVGQLLTNAAREGSRTAILDGATDASVRSQIETMVSGAVNCAAADITTAISVTNSDGTTSTSLSAVDAREMIDIEVSIAFSKVSYLPATWLDNATLRGQAAMRKD